MLIPTNDEIEKMKFNCATVSNCFNLLEEDEISELNCYKMIAYELYKMWDELMAEKIKERINKNV